MSVRARYEKEDDGEGRCKKLTHEPEQNCKYRKLKTWMCRKMELNMFLEKGVCNEKGEK